MEAIAPLINLGIPLLFLIVAYIVGVSVERKHYASIREREEALRALPTVTFRQPPADWSVTDATLVTGSVVVSVDYFKRFLAGLRMVFGGRLGAYETLMDRGRREALLRMREQAQAKGYGAVINVRLETSALARARGDGKGSAGVEVLAFGTALRLS
jgi:uncharacterized protein YbjQ (UPF0145 family)